MESDKKGAEPWGPATDLIMSLTYAPRDVKSIIKKGQVACNPNSKT